jgi:hypothetical protein
MLTDDQIRDLANQIREHYRWKGYAFMDSKFRVITVDADYRWNPIDCEAEAANYQQFIASNRFIP